jgi:hypothetical protein
MYFPVEELDKTPDDETPEDETDELTDWDPLETELIELDAELGEELDDTTLEEETEEDGELEDFEL